MNDTLFPKPPREPDDRLPHIHRLLLGHYGQPKPREPWDPLKQFIYSLLSTRTKTETTHQVVRHLQTRFASWDDLRDASVREIEDAIRDVTFPDQKAVNLKASLEQITHRYGKLTLDFLAHYRTDKIRAWLEQFPVSGQRPALRSSTSVRFAAAHFVSTRITFASPSGSVSHRALMPPPRRNA